MKLTRFFVSNEQFSFVRFEPTLLGFTMHTIFWLKLVFNFSKMEKETSLWLQRKLKLFSFQKKVLWHLNAVRCIAFIVSEYKRSACVCHTSRTKEEMPSDRIVSVNLLRLPSYLCSNSLHRDRHVLSVCSVWGWLLQKAPNKNRFREDSLY